LELLLNALRTSALPALMSVVAKMSHMVIFPTQVLSRSIQREKESSAVMVMVPGALFWIRV
jgi:hypothetical protein